MPNQPKINLALALGLILTIVGASVTIGYFYIQNTLLESDKTNLQDDLTSLQSQVSDLQEEINTLQETITESYQTGYGEGYTQGVEDGAGTGFNIRDPTYQEALQFIASDQTEQNQYNEETYTCFEFVADFEANAFQVGYRVGFVFIEFVDGAHSIVAFDTVDKGLIFIEPQDDEIVTLTVGQTYWDRIIYEPPDYNDIIIRFVVIW